MQISPGSPAGMSFPASSQMRTAVEQIGRPAEPVNAVESSGLIVAAGEVSVRPYACTIGRPVTSCHCLATASWTAMPPPMVSLSARKSMRGNPGSFRSAANIVFTPVM